VQERFVVDANIIINLLHVKRLALLAALPGYECVVPEEVDLPGVFRTS